jgi:RNA recognition motif-containing protein
VDQINIITERDTGRARGFGFVDMPDSRAGQVAIQGLQGTVLGGRTL